MRPQWLRRGLRSRKRIAPMLTLGRLLAELYEQIKNNAFRAYRLGGHGKWPACADLPLRQIRRAYAPAPGRAMAYGRDRWKPKMQAFNADVQDRILALVRAILEQNAISVEVNPGSRLVDVGLTSMDMVNPYAVGRSRIRFCDSASRDRTREFPVGQNAGADGRQSAAAQSGGPIGRTFLPDE